MNKIKLATGFLAVLPVTALLYLPYWGYNHGDEHKYLRGKNDRQEPLRKHQNKNLELPKEELYPENLENLIIKYKENQILMCGGFYLEYQNCSWIDPSKYDLKLTKSA